MNDLRPYQQEAAAFLCAARRAIYGDPPGTGKTLGTIGALEHFEDFERALVVAPMLGGAGITRWQGELLYGRGIPSTDLTGPPAKRAWARDQLATSYDSVIGVTNYDLMRRDIDQLLGVGFTTVVFDEAHRLKNRNALVVKAARRLAKRADHLVFVTGTPIVNAADDLWSLLNMIDPKAYSSYWRWTEEHCNVERRHFPGARWETKMVKGLKPGHAERIAEELASIVIQRPVSAFRDQLGDEPQEIVWPVKLSAGERKLYDQMENDFFAELDDGDVVAAPNALVQMGFQRQITSNWSRVANVAEPGTKVKATVELVNDLVADGEQVVVMAAFKDTVRTLQSELGTLATTYTGDRSNEQKRKALEDFRAGHRRVIVGTLAAMGEGVDGLQVARQLVMVDRDWSPTRVDQAVGRVRRSGQSGDVVVHHMVAADSTDQRIAEALVAKRDLADAILG